MGRVDYVPIRPWKLATNTLTYSAEHIKALLVLFAVPELFRLAVYFANDQASQAHQPPEYLPNWALSLMSYAVSAVIFTRVIRYIAITGKPQWLPDHQLIRNYLLTAVVLTTVMNIIDFFTGSSPFSTFYVRYFMSEEPDEWRMHLWGVTYYVGGFLIAAILIAAAYPSLGMTAVRGQFHPRRILRWNRKYLWPIFAVTLLLMSACLIGRRAYWWLLNALTSNRASIDYAQDPNLNAVINQLTYVPMDIVFDIVPAVAIGLLYRVLQANSADL